MFVNFNFIHFIITNSLQFSERETGMDGKAGEVVALYYYSHSASL